MCNADKLQQGSPINSAPNSEGWWGKRHTFLILGFLGTAISCSIQNGLSLAIVPMTETVNQDGYKRQVTDHGHMCQSKLNLTSSFEQFLKGLHYPIRSGLRPIPPPVLQWTEKQQGIVLGAFWWGYVLTLYPGGFLAQRYGGKWIVAGGVGISGFLSVLLPFLTLQFDWFGLIIVRALQGMSQGATCPALQVMLAHWTPVDERSRMTNLIYSGYPFGSALTMITGGYLIRFYNWCSVFFWTGAMSMVWLLLWIFLVYSTPKEHPTISDCELHHISQPLKENSVSGCRTPWRKIFQSLPVWAIWSVSVGQFWAKNTIQTEMPKFLRAAHNLRIDHIGWIAALPQLLNCAFGAVVSWVSDILISKQVTTVEFTRKFCALIGCGTSGALLGLGLYGCDSALVMTFFLAGGVVSGASRGSWMVNILDIAPNHAGTIMAVGSLAADVLGILAPYLTGMILNSHAGLLGWRIVFFIGAGTNFAVGVVFLTLGKAEEQRWN